MIYFHDLHGSQNHQIIEKSLGEPVKDGRMETHGERRGVFYFWGRILAVVSEKYFLKGQQLASLLKSNWSPPSCSYWLPRQGSWKQLMGYLYCIIFVSNKEFLKRQEQVDLSTKEENLETKTTEFLFIFKSLLMWEENKYARLSLF